MDWELTDRQRDVLRHYVDGDTTPEIAEALEVAPTTIETHRRAIQQAGVPLEYDHAANEWFVDGSEDGLELSEPDVEEGDEDTGVPVDLEAINVDADAEPSPDDLTDRERVVVSELETGATVAEIEERLGERESIVTEHIRDLKRSGWHVYVDESAEMVAIESDRPLRSSEHKGTRTRKANKWWELRHNELVREFRGLARPSPNLHETSGKEDWVTHLTDLHAGDRVRDDDGGVVYSTDAIPEVVDYITSQSLALAEKHGSTYDTAHLLWGGDMVTNEGIYEGQYEDLDAWLDEQHESLIDPLVRQIKAFAEGFPRVNVVCQVGNHGQHRASGTSSQANADLILYKSIRNVIAQLQGHADILENVSFDIGEARAYKNFEMRDGEIRGHLRHGQHRRPQAETSARDKEWTKTLLDHQFDVAYMGHYHVSGRIPWDGPPILASSSPKPAGEFVENIGGRVPGGSQGVATAHGVSDDGLTGVFPVDMRKYDHDSR